MGEEVVTSKIITQGKDWMKDRSASSKQDRAIVEQDCEKDGCGNSRMYFSTMQTRSVDEGQTVYYECTKCGTKFAQNT